MAAPEDSGVPVTYVRDPDVTLAQQEVTVESGGTIAVINPGTSQLNVHVVGTLPVTLTLAGSITATIGAIKITDDNMNVSVTPPAFEAKNGNTTALVVQHIDDFGLPLRQQTQLQILWQGSNTHQHVQQLEAIDAAILNNQGTLATESTQIRVSNNGSISNGYVTEILDQLRAEFSIAHRDAFDRLRTSNPVTLFSWKALTDNSSIYWDDQQTSGAGTSSTLDLVNARYRIAVAGATAGTRVRQTLRRFAYEPGKSQMVFMTFNMNAATAGITERVGLFDAFNGLYLERSGSTVSFVIRKNGLAAETFAQAAWNVDPLNGAGPSETTLDLSRVQIFFIDYEWLGTGTVRFGFVINGSIVVCHTAHHANTATSVYTSTPNLPLRYEISNSGAGAAATLDCICATVISEGGNQDTGYPRTVDRTAFALATGNNDNLHPALGVRLKSTGTVYNIFPSNLSVICTTNSVLQWVLVTNPVVSGGTAAWTSLTGSPVEYNNQTTGTNVATGGVAILSGYTQAGQQTDIPRLPANFGLGTYLNGNREELWLCVRRITGTNETVYASLSFTEQ